MVDSTMSPSCKWLRDVDACAAVIGICQTLYAYTNYEPGPFVQRFFLLMLHMTLLVAAIIGREITMSALREWAASCSQEAHQAVAVSSWGKWKTATQVRPHVSAACVSFPT